MSRADRGAVFSPSARNLTNGARPATTQLDVLERQVMTRFGRRASQGRLRFVRSPPAACRRELPQTGHRLAFGTARQQHAVVRIDQSAGGDQQQWRRLGLRHGSSTLTSGCGGDART